MKVKSQKDFWSGLMFVIVGGAFAIGALNYSFGSSARPGPAYFPFGLGVLLAILGAMILFESLTIETEDGEPIGAFAWKPLVVILASVLIFGFLLPRLGMVISLPLLVLVSSYASDEHTWLGSIINAVVLTVMSWAVFVLGLKLTIPMWPAFLG
ncbi:MAG TPA: tripartite tricarboxylate transporter TctB family protein [Ideonella sp.]|nr:tripartite tricarboxylate transporter TctB family protein [Ideonella sp.]